MKTFWKAAAISFLVMTFCTVMPVAVMMAAEFEMAWEKNPDTDNILGYYLYYKEGSSIIENPTGYTKIQIDNDMTGFISTQPGHTLKDLKDDVRYFFVVTAYNASGESDMSGEVSGVNGTDFQATEPGPSSSSTSGSSSGGCYLKSLYY